MGVHPLGGLRWAALALVWPLVASQSALVHTSAPRPCPEGYSLRQGECYGTESHVTSWLSCTQLCRRKGGFVPCVERVEQSAAVASLATRDAWLGYGDRQLEGTYAWDPPCTSSFAPEAFVNSNGACGRSAHLDDSCVHQLQTTRNSELPKDQPARVRGVHASPPGTAPWP